MKLFKDIKEFVSENYLQIVDWIGEISQTETSDSLVYQRITSNTGAAYLFKGGLTIQYGVVWGAPTSGTYTVTLPKSLGNNSPYICLTPAGLGEDIFLISSERTSTSFTFKARSATKDSINVIWLAIGRWK